MNWVKVEDRLPPGEMRVLILLERRDGTGKASIEVSDYTPSKYECFMWRFDKDIYYCHEVTHWMELPKPPGISESMEGVPD